MRTFCHCAGKYRALDRWGEVPEGERGRRGAAVELRRYWDSQISKLARACVRVCVHVCVDVAEELGPVEG